MDKCATEQLTYLFYNFQMNSPPHVRNGQRSSLEIYSSDKLICGQVCLQNQTIFNSPTELKRNTIKGGRHKKAAAKMAEDENSDIKRKSKGFLQSNSAQMDSA